MLAEQKPRSPGHRRLSGIGLGMLGFIAAALLVAPMLAYPFGRDQGTFACGADVLRRGGVLYRDFWDLKPPGIYYLYLWSFAAFGHSMLAPRLLDLLFSLAIAAGLVLMGSRLASLGAGVAAGILFICRYALGFGYWAGAQADAFASLPLTAAGLTMLAAEHRRSWPLAALCGVLIGLAIVIKFTLGIFFLLPMIALAVSRDERVTDRGTRAAAYLLGGLGVVAVAIFPVWRGHALKDMLEIMFSWDLHYAALGTSGLGIIIAQTWGFWWGHAYAIVELIGLLALVGLTDLALRRDAGRFRWLAPAWLALMLIQVHVQAKYFNYQWLPAVPPLGLLAGIGVAALWRLLRERTGSVGTAGWLAAPGMVVLLAALTAGYRAQFGNEIAFATGRMSATTFAGYFKAGQDFSLSADLQVAAFLKRNTAPDASVFIWGFEPIIYFLAERPPASRFISQQPLITPWSPPEWRDELLRELAQRRPQYILVVHNDAIPWATSRHVDSARELAHFPALADLLRREYRLKVVIEDFDIWQRLRSS